MRTSFECGRVSRVVGTAILALIGCGVAVDLFWLAGRSSLEAVTSSGPDSPADLLVLIVAALGMTLTAWLGVGFAISALASLPGAMGRTAATVSAWLAPALVRRAAAVALGTALSAAAVPGLAHADGAPPTGTVTTSVAHDAPPDPAFVVTDGGTRATSSPTRTPTATQTAGAEAYPHPGMPVASTPSTSPRTPTDLGPLGQAPRPADTRTVTVVRGDSLWRIAARHLGPAATDEQIAQEWPRWYAANRAVIGPNADLVRVGQVLTVPASESAD